MGWQKEKCGRSEAKEGSIDMNLEDRDLFIMSLSFFI